MSVLKRPAEWRGRRGKGALALFLSCGLPASALLVGAAPWLAYREGPPPGFTGGFGEESCGGCHFGGAVNDSSGSFRLTGVPATFEAGKSYPIMVSLVRPGMEAGGFQLSARLRADGSQAGSLAVDPTDAERIELVTDRDVQYLHQRHAGSDAGASDSLHWKLIWTAPPATSEVVFHASANAANGDESTSGDFIYTVEVASKLPAN